MISYEQSKKILKNAKIKIKDEMINSVNSLNRLVSSNVYSSINVSLNQSGFPISSSEIRSNPLVIDLDNNRLYYSKNGTWQDSGDPTSGSTGTGAISITADKTYFMYCSDYASSGNRSATQSQVFSLSLTRNKHQS